ncbi:MAG: peroxiredoxin [Gammaproteobacteria bacterium]|nr:peroxiredoxin [Gammaproteobacteria bacterium]
MSTLVGRKAPDFTASAVLGTGEIVSQFKLGERLKGKYGLLFFYPLDFTFVCPSELIALNHRLKQFKERDTEVIGISVDSHYTHHAWRKTPLADGGVGALQFTLVSDLNHSISQNYGVLVPEGGVAFRGTFLIDKNGVVRSEIVNDLPLGRNIDELVRLVDALQHHEKHGEVCPAGWNKNSAAITPSTEGIAEYLAKHADRL